MSTTKPIPQQFTPTDGGFRLGDYEFMRQAILNSNSASSTYGIAAAGTTQATATPLTSVNNQVDTVGASSGVNLPLSTGKHSTPCQVCNVINNGANTLTVYGFQGSADTINGIAGSTGVTIPVGATVGFLTVKGGAWFTGDTSDAGSFSSITNSGNFTETGVGSGFVQKQSATGAGRAGTFTLNGATTVTVTNTTVAVTDFIGISMNTAAGTIGAFPKITAIQPGASFTILGTASDTSVYNYSMFGVN
jgi:hypothetical protein